MTDDTSFDAENPFRKLDKKQFLTKKEQEERRKAPQKKVRASADEAAAQSFYAQFGSADSGDERAFLSAMSGVQRFTAESEKRPAAKKQPPLRASEVEKGARTKTAPAGLSLGTHLASALEQQAEQAGASGSPAAGTAAPETASAGTASVENDVSRKDLVRQKSRDAVVRQEERVAEVQAMDEEDVFSTAMRDVAPLSGKGRDIPTEVRPKILPPQHPNNPMQDFMEGKLEFALAFTNEYVEGHVLGLDLFTVGKLQAGQFSPEAHLDLHGMTAPQAFEAMVGFIKGSYFKGYRTLLLVPGRGLNSPQGVSILRAKVQDWLTQDPFKRVVLAFCTARQSDGGAGALYVLLRKYRKGQGKVHWDRRPADPDLL